MWPRIGTIVGESVTVAYSVFAEKEAGIKRICGIGMFCPRIGVPLRGRGNTFFIYSGVSLRIQYHPVSKDNIHMWIQSIVLILPKICFSVVGNFRQLCLGEITAVGDDCCIIFPQVFALLLEDSTRSSKRRNAHVFASSQLRDWRDRV